MHVLLIWGEPGEREHESTLPQVFPPKQALVRRTFSETALAGHPHRLGPFRQPFHISHGARVRSALPFPCLSLVLHFLQAAELVVRLLSLCGEAMPW